MGIPTEQESIDQKIQSAQKWMEANPGKSWAESHSSDSDEAKIWISKEILASDAFRSLSRVAHLVYLDFLAKRKMVAAGRVRGGGRRNAHTKWECVNNGEIQYPYSEAESQVGINRVGFRNAIDELQRKGFIDITHLGKGGRKPKRGTGDSTLYLLDDRWREYDEAAGASTIPPKMPRRKDTRMDRGFQNLWAKN